MGEHIFISYSWHDRDYVRELFARMHDYGLRPWMFEHDQVPSVSFLDQLMAVISDARAVVVVLSPRSMDSTAVTQEVLYAIEKRKPILPLLLEEGDGRVAFLLRPFHWIDARSEPYPLRQIAEALGLTLGAQFPAVRLKALPGHAHLVRPAEITLEVPHHAWARLLAEPGYEVELGTIGALPDRTLVVSLDLPAVSRRHAHITVGRSAEDGWIYTLYDTSHNGTWVNGQRVRGSCELSHDALIGLVGEALMLQFGVFDRSTLDAPPAADAAPERERAM